MNAWLPGRSWAAWSQALRPEWSRAWKIGPRSWKEWVQLRVADPARVLLDQDLVRPRIGEVDLLHSERARPAGEHTVISIYDVSGRLVWERRVRSGQDNRVSVAWDGHSSDGKQVAPGVYLVKVKAGKQTALAKIVMLK